MKLALNGLAHYTDFRAGYELYKKRSRKNACVDYAAYKRAVREYCSILAERLVTDGMVDLPGEIGSIVAVEIVRRPQYRGKTFIGYGKKDWSTGHFDGTLKTFGLMYMPRHGKNNNLRCFGFVANRRLFKKVKEAYEKGNWNLLEFNDEMI